MIAGLRKLLISAAISVAFPGFAQDQSGANAIIVADKVFVTADNMLVAEGHVEALQGDVRLKARKIEYDANADLITVTGPIHIHQGEYVRIVASYAELDTDFRNAILQSARMVLDDQVQMAASELNRVEGRYNVLHKTTVSSCRVCNDGRAPLWQIRAHRVVHDQEERQLYFDHAQFRVLDVPIFYFPQLRMPDPTLDRATGFLIPELVQDSQLGFGAKIPYFIKLGEHRDLTLTPYIGEHTRTLEFRYRQAFKNGRMNWIGAISDDSLNSRQPRSYLFGDGWFDLPRDYRLSFNIKTASDDTYLLDYDYSDEDRLNSDITVRRATRDENTRFAILHYESLRANDDNATLPSIVALAETERRYFPAAIGGELRMRAKMQGHYRTSSSDIDGPDPDPEADGRDMVQASASAFWRRNWTLKSGLRTGVTGELAFDGFKTYEDAIYEGTESQVTPTVAAHFRYPMTRRDADGGTQILEPVAQLSWSGGDRLSIANDGSTRVEFDEGNLLALSRFPSTDRRERGFVAAAGLNWARYSPDGWRANLSFGQIYQENPHPDFSLSSGLSGSRSDLLLAGQIVTDNGLSLMGRALLDSDGTFNKASARAGWTNNRLYLDASVVWLSADPQEDRVSNISEWVFDTRYRMNRHWTALADWRYNVTAGQSAEAEIGLEYRNECVQIGLSVSRNFITTGNVQSRTQIGLTVTLVGFSVKSEDKSYNRTCSTNAG